MARHDFGYGDGPGINNYVPAMQYLAGMEVGGILSVSLGTPTGYDEDAINNDQDGDPSANTTVYQSEFTPGGTGIGYETDAEYGQNLVMKVSADPGAGGIDIDVYGEDYLGQPMIETLTTANGATAAVEGVKAFKRVTKVVVTNPATNAITFDLGWGYSLGLPVKLGRLIGGKEAGIRIDIRKRYLDPLSANVGDGANTFTWTAPYAGYLGGAEWLITTAQATAAATLALTVAAVAKTAGNITIPIGAAGLSGVKDIAKASRPSVSKGDAIVWTSDAAGDSGVVSLTPFLFGSDPDIYGPVLTDPQTKTTGDPRGLYKPQLAANGSREFIVDYMPDASVNTSDNGGLHGIQHYMA